jgi:hypothetical protein
MTKLAAPTRRILLTVVLLGYLKTVDQLSATQNSLCGLYAMTLLSAQWGKE